MYELYKLFVHALHAKFCSGLNDSIKLMCFAFADDVSHRRSSHQYFGCSNPPAADGRDEAL